MMGVNPLMMMTPFMNGYSGMNMGMPMSTVPNMQGMPMMQNMAQPQQTLNPNMAQVSQPASQTFSSKAPVVDVRWLKDNLVSFKAKSLTEQKNILGNIMYQKVVEICTDKSQVPKITGMLIDLDVLSIEEIIEILETKPLLLERIEEAQKIIEEEGQN